MNPLKDLTELLDKYTDWWETNNPGYNLWLFISALRGPDSQHSPLKERTTKRLRTALNARFFHYPPDGPLPDMPINNNEGKQDFKDRIIGSLIHDFPNADTHFLSHYVDACWAYWKLINKR